MSDSGGYSEGTSVCHCAPVNQVKIPFTVQIVKAYNNKADGVNGFKHSANLTVQVQKGTKAVASEVKANRSYQWRQRFTL